MTAKILPFDPRPRDLVIVHEGRATRINDPSGIEYHRFFVSIQEASGDKNITGEYKTREEALYEAKWWALDGFFLVDHTEVQA